MLLLLKAWAGNNEGIVVPNSNRTKLKNILFVIFGQKAILFSGFESNGWDCQNGLKKRIGETSTYSQLLYFSFAVFFNFAPVEESKEFRLNFLFR